MCRRARRHELEHCQAVSPVPRKALHFFARAPPSAAAPRSDMSPTLEADGSIACAIFSHLEHPRDRIALAAVSRVFRDAEKSDASLPGGLSACLNCLGDKFYEGAHDGNDEHETKYAKALYWWRKGADRGDAASMQGIGYCYYFGEGVELDHRKAFEWVEKASELGHAEATCDLADYYRSGIGVEKDVPKAVELYVKAAGLGDSYAARELGYIYEGGWWGVARDKKEALKWYRVAVELGTTDAQRHLDRVEAELRRTHTN